MDFLPVSLFHRPFFRFPPTTALGGLQFLPLYRDLILRIMYVWGENIHVPPVRLIYHRGQSVFFIEYLIPFSKLKHIHGETLYYHYIT